MAEMRLQRFLSQAGVAARRKGEKLIVAGRVQVNGKVVTELGSKVDAEKDTVRVDGVAVEPEALVYLVLNKPKGTVTTVSDPEGRPTVMDLVPDLGIKIAPVGRLDFYTEGVLLLTNDGELQAGLLGPRAQVEKTYHVKLHGQIKAEDLDKWRAGVVLDDGKETLPAKVDVLRNTGTHTWLVVSITEGRSRQIHRTAEALGHVVLKLARVAFAGVTYHGLKIGECRRLAEEEVRELRKLAGLSADEGRPRAEPGRLSRPTKVAKYPGGGEAGDRKGNAAMARAEERAPSARSLRRPAPRRPEVRRDEMPLGKPWIAARGEGARPAETTPEPDGRERGFKGRGGGKTFGAPRREGPPQREGRGGGGGSFGAPRREGPPQREGRGGGGGSFGAPRREGPPQREGRGGGKTFGAPRREGPPQARTGGKSFGGPRREGPPQREGRGGKTFGAPRREGPSKGPRREGPRRDAPPRGTKPPTRRSGPAR